MKKIIFTIFSTIISFSVFAQLNVTYKGNITYGQSLSDIWGYVAPDSSEYAIVGVANGVSIVDLADAENPNEVFFLDGFNSNWRDIKTWGTHAYVTNESGDGLMVIDLTNLPDTVTAYNWTPNIPNLGTLWTIHNIYIDEFGYAYLAGSNINNGGMIYVDVFSNPGMPEVAGIGPSVYSHDVYVRDNKMYSSEINDGVFSIYDVADKTNTILLGEQPTAFEFTHNAWLSDDSNTLYTTDELANAPVGSYDVSDPTDIKTLDQFVPFETLGDGVIPHNVHVWNDWLIISYYTDGCIIVDGSNPENLIEVGNFDTFIPPSTGFSGAWGAYPFLPSGLILISDIGNGMYVLEPNYVRACWLEGNITDANTGTGINGATVDILNTNVIETANSLGEYKTGFATAGTYEVLVKKAGYEPATVQAVLENEVITMLDVQLVPLVPFAVNGQVLEEGTNNPVPNAVVSITNADFSYDIETDANGAYEITSFYEGEYEVFAGKWGYKTTAVSAQSFDTNNNSTSITIEKGYEDVFSLDLGWTNTVTAPQGGFDRGEPIGIFLGQIGFFLTPDEDVSEDVGNHCYVTGNNADLFDGALIGGDASMTSPDFDLTNYIEPYLSYYTWYINVNPNNGNPTNVPLYVTLSNGIDTVTIDTILYPVLAPTDWTLSEINIAEHITPTANMSISFEATTSPNFNQLAEVGVDYFQVWDNSPLSVQTAIDETIQLSASPNPSMDVFVIDYELEDFNSDTRIQIFNTLGQMVATQDLFFTQGKITIGGELENGIYFAHITNGETISHSLKLVKQ